MLCSRSEVERSHAPESRRHRRPATAAAHPSGQGSQGTIRARLTSTTRSLAGVLENRPTNAVPFAWENTGCSHALSHHPESLTIERPQWLDQLESMDWNVFIEGPPRDRSRPSHMVRYLARYLTGGPISDSRILSFNRDEVYFLARPKRTNKSGSDRRRGLANPIPHRGIGNRKGNRSGSRKESFGNRKRHRLGCRDVKLG